MGARSEPVRPAKPSTSAKASAQLNDAPYPNHVFTAVIWGSDRRQFQPALENWQGRAVCVTGPVEFFATTRHSRTPSAGPARANSLAVV